MASASDFEMLQAALRAKDDIIEVQKKTIEQLREQLAGSSKPAEAAPKKPTNAPKPANAPEPVKAQEHEVPKEAKAADYVLAASPKAVTLKTFNTYAKGPVTKNAFFYQALAYLRTVCKNGVDEHRRAMDALVGYHGDGSTLELASMEVEPNKFVVSFDTWGTLFAAAGFVPGPSPDYAPVHDLAKIPAQSSKAKSSTTPTKTTATDASAALPYKVVPRTAEA